MPGSLTVGDINGAGLGVPNLVINPEFTINQRGAASRTATSSAYNFDRWYYDGANLLQGIESLNLRPGTYVISWVGSSTCAYSLNTAASSAQGAQSYAAVTNGSTIAIGTVGSNNLWLRFTSDLANLNKVKLVLGSVATPFEHRPYGAELALCERYGELVEATIGNHTPFASGSVTNATGASVTLPFRTKKRGTPTATISAASGFALTNANGTTNAVTWIVTDRIDLNAITMSVGVASGLVAGNATRLVANNTANPSIFISSEL